MVKVLDCTLRDGGYVNNWEFGTDSPHIIKKLIDSGVDIIELGFLRDGHFANNQTVFNTIAEVKRILPEMSSRKTEYSLMIRPDWYDITQLVGQANEVKYIRFAFYYSDRELLKMQCEYVRKLGYEVILNPVNVCQYTDEEYMDVLKLVNEIHPVSLTIVDTFGSLTVKRLREICEVIKANLDEGIAVGCHLHENMLLSSTLMREFLELMGKERNVIVDGSLNGIGRIPGNLPTETLADIVNQELETDRYSLEDIYEAVSRFTDPIKKEHYWGYSPAFYYSGKMIVHRSYPEYYLMKPDLTLKDIKILIDQISITSDRWEFDKQKAEDYLRAYQKNE